MKDLGIVKNGVWTCDKYFSTIKKYMKCEYVNKFNTSESTKQVVGSIIYSWKEEKYRTKWGLTMYISFDIYTKDQRYGMKGKS